MKATWAQREDGIVEVIIKSRIAPPVQHWSIDTVTTYRFTGEYVSVQVVGEPRGERLPETLPGLVWRPPSMAARASSGYVQRTFWVYLPLAIYPISDHGSWNPAAITLLTMHPPQFGRGPGQSYRDMKESQLIGTWEEAVDDLFVDYDFPQENGQRTDVRWVEFLPEKKGEVEASKRLLRAQFGDFEGASFQALHYSAADLRPGEASV